ncbi:MAG: PTS sugar transporter subunit IIA [Deltaproteobacteria bacterium]|nr:PTS sugar transporter subunit IIA [Deltaproteobacteria bacterium]
MDFDFPLLGLAMVLLAGIIGGELLGRLKLPKVTGWIGTGIALRAMDLPGLEPASLTKFAPFTNFVLGYIAFTVGATLHWPSLRNAGKRLSLLLAFEAVVIPMIVVPSLMWVGGMSLDVSLVLGAIAIAGAPGTTVLVIREARARGILSRTLIAAVGLIDMVAVGAFAFATSLLRDEAKGLLSLEHALEAVASEFGMAGGIGLGFALLVVLLSRTVVGPAFLGPMMVTVILGAWGVGQALGASSILACTFAGIAISNIRHDTARAGEAYLVPFGGVLFAGFYTLAGMRLDFGLVIPLAGLVALYFGARLAGKWLGSFLSMTLAGVTNKVRHYLGLALLPHGGVAVGLIFFVQADPGLSHMGNTVGAVGLAALAINQLLGPSATRWSLTRAGEVAKDRPRLLDFLSEQRIVAGLTGTTKRELIEQLADRLYATSKLPLPKEEFIAQVMARENEDSTCLGKGFMIPHATLDEGKEVRGVLGISTKGIDLDAPDGRPVHAIVLLSTPRADRQRHLQILAAFASAITRNVNFREQLYASSTAAHAYDVLHAEESEVFNYFLDDALQEVVAEEPPPT